MHACSWRSYVEHFNDGVTATEYFNRSLKTQYLHRNIHQAEKNTYKEGVPCQSDSPKPLQFNINILIGFKTLWMHRTLVSILWLQDTFDMFSPTLHQATFLLHQLFRATPCWHSLLLQLNINLDIHTSPCKPQCLLWCITDTLHVSHHTLSIHLAVHTCGSELSLSKWLSLLTISRSSSKSAIWQVITYWKVWRTTAECVLIWKAFKHAKFETRTWNTLKAGHEVVIEWMKWCSIWCGKRGWPLVIVYRNAVIAPVYKKGI